MTDLAKIVQGQPEALATEGIRKNQNKTFKLEYTGDVIYAFLQRLQKSAVEAQDYLECLAFVLWAESIRGQCKEQGF